MSIMADLEADAIARTHAEAGPAHRGINLFGETAGPSDSERTQTRAELRLSAFLTADEITALLWDSLWRYGDTITACLTEDATLRYAVAQGALFCDPAQLEDLVAQMRTVAAAGDGELAALRAAVARVFRLPTSAA